MVGTIEHVYEVQICGRNYDGNGEPADDLVTLRQYEYHSYEDARALVVNKHPWSWLYLELEAGTNGLDICIIDRTFVDDDEMCFEVIDEWCCYGDTLYEE